MSEEKVVSREVSWRIEELERAGYPIDLAIELAENTEVDLHIAVDIVKKGCPPERAVEILT